jgi:uncharacterized alpha-E superfamily protein
MLSRVAESLYWMSRYIERAENNARILDVNVQLMLDYENHGDSRGLDHWRPIISSLEEHELFSSLHESATADSVTDFVTFERKNPNSIHSCLSRARENARTVREQISSEMWEELNGLYLFLNSDHSRRVYHTSAYEFFKKVVQGSHLFQGITDSTMTHGEGWEFIQLGKSIERADSTSRILDIKYHILLPSGEKVGGNVDIIQWMAVLRSCSALEAYRKLYVNRVAPWKVAEFLITHATFPRSIRFCVDALDAALHRISGTPGTHFSCEAERLSGRLCSELDYSTVADIFNFGLHQYLDKTQKRLIDIGKACHDEYFNWMEAEPAAK